MSDAVPTPVPTPVPEYPPPPMLAAEPRPDARKAGMLAFFVSEAAFFGTLAMTYLVYLGDSDTGPTRAEALSMPLAIANTICLLASSFTAHLAEGRLHEGCRGGFVWWWGLTIGLGIAFLAGTAYEWHELWHVHGLTLSRNLFGTTYYTLVGFHALHVTVGVALLILMLAMKGSRPIGVEMTAWYWHFVDGVWVVVFLVVYVIGR